MQLELERLNTATDEINSMELQLDVSIHIFFCFVRALSIQQGGCACYKSSVLCIVYHRPTITSREGQGVYK